GDPCQDRSRTEANDIGCGIRRSARDEGSPGHFNDRNRRLGRYASHFTPEVLVEHDIADDQHTLIREALQNVHQWPIVHTASAPSNKIQRAACCQSSAMKSATAVAGRWSPSDFSKTVRQPAVRPAVTSLGLSPTIYDRDKSNRSSWAAWIKS